MQKLRLNLEDLVVTSFAAHAADANEPGTVQAHVLVFGPTRANTCQTCETNCLPYC